MEFVGYFTGALIGVLVVFLGMLSAKYPSEYGSNTGINLPRARRSKENWDYAQKRGPLIFIRYGIINTILNIIVSFYCILSHNFTNELPVIGIYISVIFITIAIINIEIAIANFELYGE